MADDERLTQSLQESVICLLAVSDRQGRIASGLIKADHFDGYYRDFAMRLLDFHKKQGKAPGLAHIDDVVDEIISDPKHKQHKQYVRILDSVGTQAPNINEDYVLSRISHFIRRQTIKSAVIEAGTRYQQQTDNEALDEIEQDLYKALKFKDEGLTTGVRLNDPIKALAFLDTIHSAYSTGIPELDRFSIGPTPGEMLLLIAPKGMGKSWACVDIAVRCLMQRPSTIGEVLKQGTSKVLHISLEMSEPRVLQRYFQRLFAIPKHKGTIKFNEPNIKKGKLIGFTLEEREPEITLSSPSISRFLRQRINQWGVRLANLIIKSFPAKSLTINKLNAYLDYLEIVENFIPNVVIIDYPDLMAMDKNNPRISLGWTFEELRGIFQTRNIAGFCPTQGNRLSWDAPTVKGSMIAEDASKLMTADMAIIYSQTPMERKMGLARLDVEKNRNDEDKFTVGISQNYRTGQFMLRSWQMGSMNEYRDLVGYESEKGPEEEEE